MKILLDKQTPIIPNKTNTPEAPNGVFDFLTHYLFGNVMANQDQSTFDSNQNLSEQKNENDLILDKLEQADYLPVSLPSIDQLLTEMITAVANKPVSTDATIRVGNKIMTAKSVTDAPLPAQHATMMTKPVANVTPELLKALTESNKNDLPQQTDIADVEKLTDNHQKLTAKMMIPANNNKPTLDYEKTSILDEIKADNDVSLKYVTTAQQASVAPQAEENELKQSINNWLTQVNQNNAHTQPLNQASPNIAHAIRQPAGSQFTPAPPEALDSQVSFHLQSLEMKNDGNGHYQMRIQVNPPELGPMTAILKVVKNKIEISIMTKNSHIEQVVKAHLAALTDHFNQSPMQLASVTVQNAEMSGQQHQQQSSSKMQTYADEELKRLPITATQDDEKTKKSDNKLIDAYI